MFALVETANDLTLFKNEKIHSKYDFKDIHHAQKVYYELLNGNIPNEVADFLLENGVDKLVVDKSLLKSNKNENLSDVKFIENQSQLRLLKEKIKIDRTSTRGLSHVMAQKNVNFYTLDPLIVQSYALFKQIELDMEKYDKRAMEIYLNYLPELKIKKRPSNEKKPKDCITFTDITASDGSKITVDNSHVFYKEKFDIEVIQALWKIKEQNIDWINTSVGMELSDDDWNNLKRIISLFNIKKENAKSLEKYLIEKLSEHAPNLTALLGFKLAAEIISLTGSLINLSKCTAGTIQVLGAEKALFRSLKSKTPTPKYGILKNNPYTTSPRIIRSLANKIAICARIDAFSKEKTDLYGIALKEAIINKIEKDIQIDTEEILKGVSKKLREQKADNNGIKQESVKPISEKQSGEAKKRKSKKHASE